MSRAALQAAAKAGGAQQAEWSVSRCLAAATGAFVFLGGTASFLGWAVDVYRLTDWSGSGITMKPNAALAAAAAGLALLLTLKGAHQTGIRVLGIFVAAIGGATLLEHLTGWNLGIDTLLFDEAPGALATAAPGRMGPPASISFLAAGAALVFSMAAARRRRWSVVLGIAVTAVGALSLTGHWYGAEQMYIIPSLTGIALQTACMLLALGVGLIAVNPDCEPMRTLAENSNTGMLARRLVPLVIVVPLTIGFLRLEGQELGLYDGPFGTALRTLIEIAVLSG